MPGHNTLLSSAAPPGSSGTPSSPEHRAGQTPGGHERGLETEPREGAQSPCSSAPPQALTQPRAAFTELASGEPRGDPRPNSLLGFMFPMMMRALGGT